MDVGSYVASARDVVSEAIEIPAGYNVTWSGQYEYMLRAQERLTYIVPLTLSSSSSSSISIVGPWSRVSSCFSPSFSLVGAFWLLYFLDYNMSVAVWVGLIALAGVSAETGVVMLLYLDVALDEARREGRLQNRKDLVDVVYDGAVQRLRPKLMTTSTILVGLLPILWSQGTGADVMKRIATPMVGGVVSSLVVILIVYPVLYYIWKGRSLPAS